MKIEDAVRSVAKHCNVLYSDALAANRGTFDQYGITEDKPLRQAHFLAQFLGETGGGLILHESGAYTTAVRVMQIFGVGRHSAAITEPEAEKIVAMAMPAREHVLFERVYGGGNPHMMNELGNRPGDGWPFRGTGPLQSTGRGAAKQWAAKLGLTAGNDQEWMLDPKLVWMPSLYEWDQGKLNGFADRNDLRHIRRVINGGYNGLADCQTWFNKLWAAVRDPEKHPVQAWQAGDADPAVSQIQNALNLLGCSPKLKTDGRYGPATEAAVSWFQGIAGLKVDGIAGPVTLAAINLRFNTVRGDGEKQLPAV